MEVKPIKVSKNVLSFTNGYWEWFIHEDKMNYQITGKYLFFCKDRKVLRRIAIDEIKNNNFHYAKVNMGGKNHGAEYVLCLYYKDNNRKRELAIKYKNRSNVEYRYWKSNENTGKRNYSEKFLSKLSLEEREKWTGIKMKTLYLSFVNPKTWRNNIKEKITKEGWEKLRLKILKRDNYICQYCGFKSERWQIVHHIEGNPNNDNKNNLETICQMCNLIHHSGQGCVVQAVVDLYKNSDYPQNEIIQITRKMRIEGKSDKEIIAHLGLKNKIPFKMNKLYLKKLFGFVTSRRALEENGESNMYNSWLDYQNKKLDEKEQKRYWENKKQELRQLSYLGPKKYKKLVKIGVTTIKNLINADTQELNLKSGISTRSIEKLKKNFKAIINNKIIQVKPFNFPTDVIYFDIETDLRQSYIWMIGAYYKNKFYPFYSESRKKDKKILREFITFIKKHPKSMLCYFSPKGFDRRLLIKSFDYHKISKEDFTKREFLDLAIEIKSRFYLPTNFSLKEISQFLGYKFKYTGMNGFFAALSYEEHSIKNKNLFIDYNKEDLLSMKYLIETLNRGSPKKIKKEFDEKLFDENFSGPINEKKIIKLRNEGYKFQEIADMTGRSITYIYNKINQRNKQSKSKTFGDELLIKRLREKGYKLNEIARKLDRSIYYVASRLNKKYEPTYLTKQIKKKKNG